MIRQMNNLLVWRKHVLPSQVIMAILSKLEVKMIFNFLVFKHVRKGREWNKRVRSLFLTL